MEDPNFVLLWKEQYDKIDQALAINKRMLKDSLREKAENSLRSLIRVKAAGIVIAVLYLGFLGFLLSLGINNYSSAANYFIISIGAIFLINVKALYDYIHHLVLLNSIDSDGSITKIQEKLSRLQLSILQHTRIMFLQIPFWSTFFLSDKWFPGTTSPGLIILQIVITLSLTILALFLYKNISVSNLDKKWVKSLLSGAGGQNIITASAFYKEIESFKQEG